jgi:hypothetical protein
MQPVAITHNGLVGTLLGPVPASCSSVRNALLAQGAPVASTFAIEFSAREG